MPVTERDFGGLGMLAAGLSRRDAAGATGRQVARGWGDARPGRSGGGTADSDRGFSCAGGDVAACLVEWLAGFGLVVAVPVAVDGGPAPADPGGHGAAGGDDGAAGKAGGRGPVAGGCDGGAASTDRCIGGVCGPCASSPASARPRRRTSASATCSTTARARCRRRST